MDYKAEIFDQMQSLYHETGFNDHQVHAELTLAAGLDEERLRKATLLCLGSIPILATRYREDPEGARWLGLPESELERAFVATGDPAVFETERCYRIPESQGPQLRVCYLHGERHGLAITMNHMISDGAGFKDFLYYFCETYNRLEENPGYVPPVVDGDRSIDRITRTLGPAARLRAWLAQRGESNRAGSLAFPLDEAGETHPFIATRTMPREALSRLKDYCRARGATLNDAALAAFYRVLARSIGPAALTGLEVPIMIDMRRYLPDRAFDALRNLASTSATRLRMREGESFEETLAKAKGLMDALKSRRLGLGGFIKMSLLFSLGERTARALLRRGLAHPLICMTNIGELDAERLVLAGTAIESAYVCGSIKYKPHFQLAISGFRGSLTLSFNLYGTDDDERRVRAFLAEVESELDSRTP